MNKDIFNNLKDMLLQVKKINQYYYFMGAVSMAYTTEAITLEQYNFLITDAEVRRSIITD